VRRLPSYTRGTWSVVRGDRRQDSGLSACVDGTSLSCAAAGCCAEPGVDQGMCIDGVEVSEHTPLRGRGVEGVHWPSSRSERARFWLWSFICTSARNKISFTSPRLSSLDLSHKALQLHYHDIVNTDRCFCVLSSSNPFSSSSSLSTQLTREHRDGHPQLTARRRRDHG
jgi:hypothetical protein